MTYHPFFIYGEHRPGRWVITCDHAANTVPEFVYGGSLGLPEAEMQRHIAWDPGAAGVAKALGTALDSPVICSNFSRLVIDPNRGQNDPTLLMKLYDGTIIPGNRAAGLAELEARLNACYHPYHRALGALAARPDAVIVSVHSFTPQLKGRPKRPWEIGILYADDTRLSEPLITALEAEPDLSVGRNQPYCGHLPGDAVDRHALQQGRPNALLELRQDVIETEVQQTAWAQRLAPMLEDALRIANL
jgi:predicted N-formylglutamate amidohydrolase